MARYRNTQDLGIFVGARFLNITITDGGPQIPGIFIPVGINGIDVQPDTRDEDKRNASGFRAFISTTQRNCNSSYLNAIKQNLIRKGEDITPYNVPAYQVCYTLTEERRKRIRESLCNRLKKEHPEWKDLNDERGNALSAAISRLMPYQMGDSYLIEETGSQQAARPAAMEPQNNGYTPQVAAAPFDAPSDKDDLPF